MPRRIVLTSPLGALLFLTAIGCDRRHPDPDRSDAGRDDSGREGPTPARPGTDDAGEVASSSSGGGEGDTSSGSGGSDASGTGAGDPVGSSSSNGGGSLEGSHTIEIALDGLELENDAHHVQVFVNAVDGAPVTALDDADLPANVLVTDGDLVTFLEQGHATIRSYRVTPEVDRIAMRVSSPLGCTSEGEPMNVTITVPPIAGASSYAVRAALTQTEFVTEPGDVALELDYACGDDASVPVLVTAEDADRILSYEYIEVPFLAGGAASFSPRVENAARRAITLEVALPPGATQLNGSASWLGNAPGMWVHEAPLFLDVASPPAAYQYAAPIIAAPGTSYVGVSAHAAPVGDLCPSSSFIWAGSGDTRLAFDAAALRAPTFTDDDGWTFDGPGALGDSLIRVWAYRDGDGNAFWWLMDDPQRPPLPAVFPDLGPDFLDGPTGALERRSIQHRDGDAAGYADAVGAPRGADVMTRFRQLEVCPD